jgi:hypothetical protein
MKKIMSAMTTTAVTVGTAKSVVLVESWFSLVDFGAAELVATPASMCVVGTTELVGLEEEKDTGTVRSMELVGLEEEKNAGTSGSTELVGLEDEKNAGTIGSMELVGLEEEKNAGTIRSDVYELSAAVAVAKLPSSMYGGYGSSIVLRSVAQQSADPEGPAQHQLLPLLMHRITFWYP